MVNLASTAKKSRSLRHGGGAGQWQKAASNAKQNPEEAGRKPLPESRLTDEEAVVGIGAWSIGSAE